MRRAMVVTLLLSCLAARGAGTFDVRLENLEMSEALVKLSQAAGQVSILGDSTVKGKVSCVLSGVTIDQALNTICKMNKLEWYRVYIGVGGEEKPTAPKLFDLMDGISKVTGGALISEDPAKGVKSVFVPSLSSESAVDVDSLAGQLKMKAIYLLRAIPTPVEIVTEDASEEKQEKAAETPPSDPKAAAQQVWDYFGKMPIEQRMQTMMELRRMMAESITPEQREEMRRMWYGGGDRPPWAGNMPGPPAPN